MPPIIQIVLLYNSPILTRLILDLSNESLRENYKARSQGLKTNLTLLSTDVVAIVIDRVPFHQAKWSEYRFGQFCLDP